MQAYSTPFRLRQLMGAIVATCTLLGVFACVPYRVKHLDFAQTEVLLVGGPDVTLSLASTAGARNIGPPYDIILIVRPESPLGSQSRVGSLKLIGLSDSTSRVVSVGGFYESQGLVGAWVARENAVALPYQDYRVEGTVIIEIGQTVSTYPLRGVLRRARRTTWEFWPWSMFMGA